MIEKTLGILASWNFVKVRDKYYTLNTHYSYISYITNLYKKIIIVTSVIEKDELSDSFGKYCVSDCLNIEVVELPEVKSSLSAVKYYYVFKRKVKAVIPQVDVFYSRTPDPYSWMPAIYGHPKTIMHFVGDTIEAARYNVHWSKLKKALMITGYMPEWYMTLRAAKKSVVYSNGQHIADRLLKHGIYAKAMVSSTVGCNDIPADLPSLPQNKSHTIITFLSFISYHKGINCLMDVLIKLKKDNIRFIFNIAGKGDMLPELESFIKDNDLTSNTRILGFMNDRNKINELLDSSDLFFFPSLSEGSPRVTIEAMSRGIPLLSTPVASLPYCFHDKESIRFFNFNDSDKACEIIKEYIDNPLPFIRQRERALELVKEKYTKERFLSTVFSYEA